MKNGFSLRGLKKILLPRLEDTDSLDAGGGSALAAFGPVPGMTAGKRGGGVVDFLNGHSLLGAQQGGAERIARTQTKELSERVHL